MLFVSRPLQTSWNHHLSTSNSKQSPGRRSCVCRDFGEREKSAPDFRITIALLSRYASRLFILFVSHEILYIYIFKLTCSNCTAGCIPINTTIHMAMINRWKIILKFSSWVINKKVISICPFAFVKKIKKYYKLRKL